MKSQRIWGISGNWVEVYHACFIPTLIGRWAPKTLALVAPRAGERALDVACGTGAVTRLAARAVGAEGQVAGVDLNPDMLAVARKTRRRHDAAKIEWHEAPADKLPFDKSSFDIGGEERGAMLNQPHSMFDSGELELLLRKAGFTHIEAGVRRGHAHFESPKALVYSYGALAGLEADAATRNALVKTVSRLLKPYTGPRGLHFPVEVVQARAVR